MITNNEINRVKELENFSNDFLKKLYEDDSDSNQNSRKPIKTDINEEINKPYNNSINIPDFSITKKYRKNKRKKEPIVNQ